MDSEWKTLGNTVPVHGLYVFWSQSWAMDPRGSSPGESQNGVLTITSPPNPPIFLLDLIGNLMPGQRGQGLASAQLSLPCLSAPGALLVCDLRWTSLLFTGDVAFMKDLSPHPLFQWVHATFSLSVCCHIQDSWWWGLIWVRSCPPPGCPVSGSLCPRSGWKGHVGEDSG